MMRSTLAIAAACLVLAACGAGGAGGGLPELKPRPPGPSFDPAAGRRDAQRRALGLALDSANARTAGLDADSRDDEMAKAAAALDGLAARIAEAHGLPASEIATARANLATYRQRRDTAELARARAIVDALGKDSTEGEFAAALAVIDALETRIGQARYLSAARRTALRTAIAALRTDHRGAVAAAGPETARALASTLTGRLGATSTDAEFQAAEAAIDALETALAENAGELTDERAAAFRTALGGLRTAFDAARQTRHDANTADERRRRMAGIAAAVASGTAAGLPDGTTAASDPLAEDDPRFRFEAAREAIGQLEDAILAAAGVLDRAAIDAGRAKLRAMQDHLAKADHARIRDQLLAGLAADRHSAVRLVQGNAELSITFAGERLTIAESGKRLDRFGVWQALDYRKRLDGEDNHAVVYSNPFPTELIDPDYLRFGWWSRDDGDEIDVIPFFSAAGAARPTDREIWNREREGRAGNAALKTTWSELTYKGLATGKVAVSGTSNNDLAGTFTAEVMLKVAAEASSGPPAVQPHDVWGEITGFTVSDVISQKTVVKSDWVVTLAPTPLHGDLATKGDATFGSPVHLPTWAGNVLGSGIVHDNTDNAYWGGGIYESDPAERDTITVGIGTRPLPTDRGNVAVGVFSTGVTKGSAMGRMTGAFGATR